MPAYVGLGANLGDARATFAQALAGLRRLPGVARVRSSSLYESAPVGPVHEQPWFLNGAAALEFVAGAEPSPGELVGELLAIERALGRDRATERPGGPRVLDLDLLLWDERIVDDPGPPAVVVPHPRLHERAFALAPLVELGGPELTIPGVGRAGELLAAARSAQKVRKIV